MRFSFRKRRTEPAAPRMNRWRDPQGEKAVTQVGRIRTARRKVAVRLVVLLAGVAIVGWLITVAVTYSSRMVRELFEIHTITVEGVHHLDKQKVIELAQVKQGMPLHQVVPTALEEQIESHPWVKEAQVSRVPFHELKIAVIERKPAAVVRAASQNFLSDEEGHVLTKLGQADDDTFPLVTGVDLDGLLKGTDVVRRSIVSGIELARVIGQTFEGRLRVQAESQTNLVALIQGVRFRFGEESVEEQWERFQRVKPTLKSLNFDGAGRGVSEVDLRYDNRIIVREGGG
ncbi:MAG TPA: FtsQ-type POTRA domain-containing protein [Nitrospira sp.]|nr:FtsQ-type POTRA domain-containing protein [Nitrospira sp.]